MKCRDPTSNLMSLSEKKPNNNYKLNEVQRQRILLNYFKINQCLFALELISKAIINIYISAGKPEELSSWLASFNTSDIV